MPQPPQSKVGAKIEAETAIAQALTEYAAKFPEDAVYGIHVTDYGEGNSPPRFMIDLRFW